MTPLYLSARVTGTAGLTAAWPTGSGWERIFQGRRARRPRTDWLTCITTRHASSRLLIVSASVQPTRTVDSSQVDSDPTQSLRPEISSVQIDYKQYGIISILSALHHYAISQLTQQNNELKLQKCRKCKLLLSQSLWEFSESYSSKPSVITLALFLQNFNLPRKATVLGLGGDPLTTAQQRLAVLGTVGPATQRGNGSYRRVPDDTTLQTLLSLSTEDGDAATPCRHPSSNTTYSRGNWSFDDHMYAATCLRRQTERPVPKAQAPVRNNSRRPYRWPDYTERSTANCFEHFHRSNWRIFWFSFFPLEISRTITQL